MLHASGFRGQEINAASSINIPFYEMQVTNKEIWLHWQQWKSEKPQGLINTSHRDVSDGSPYGFPHSELRRHRCGSDGTVEISSPTNEPVRWYGVGKSGLPQFSPD